MGDLWRSQSQSSRDENGAAGLAVDRADANLLAEMAKERVASTLQSSSSGSDGGRSGGGGGSFMDSIKAATPMATPEVRPGMRSKRSEDEQIRASRRERMAQQGLVGEERDSGWRARDRSDDQGKPTAASAAQDGPRSKLQAMLGASTATGSHASAEMSPEQFTLCASSFSVL